ncbi:MAG: transcription antitermination factor NusB [Alphaproteobacteria bacterium]
MSTKTLKFTNARLNAIQALYALEVNDLPMERVIFDFLNGFVGQTLVKENEDGKEEILPLPDMDKELFSKIVQEAYSRKDELDNVIFAALKEGWENDRIEVLLQSILRAGLAEFFVNPNLDAPIIINEYVDITKSFYDNSAEPALVNAILHKFSQLIKG